jgi:hypothetical protein
MGPMKLADNITVRISNENDSEAFAKWISESKDIPVEDVKASLKEANPTSVTLVIECDGKVLLFAPTYAVALLGFIGFNPDADPRERVRALEAIKRAAQAFWGMHGVTSIATLTREDYPVAQWALKHGFVKEPRQVLVLSSAPDSVKAN